jgi:NAD(P)-dependent dehydrogenase (short-subunit alcohol dehydrogenase family)
MTAQPVQIPAAIPRAALVTGGGRRLGHAIALALAEAGFAVAIHCRASRTEAERTAAACRAHGVDACVVQADLADEAATAGLVAEAAAVLGPVGVLVNNASLFERDEWDSVTAESWNAHMATNLRAPFVLIQAFAGALPAGSQGLVVNLIDQRVWALTPHFVSYTVSKAALWTLTQTMALALAPRIRVNAIGPGPALPSPRQSQEQFARQEAAVPLRHGTSPAEIAQAVLAILRMPAMTGQMIALDGGQHLNWYPPSGYDALGE